MENTTRFMKGQEGLVRSYIEFVKTGTERKIIKKKLAGWVVGKKGGIQMIEGKITKHVTIFNRKAMVEFDFGLEPFECERIVVKLSLPRSPSPGDLFGLWMHVTDEMRRQLGDQGRALDVEDDGVTAFSHFWKVGAVDVKATACGSQRNQSVTIEIEDPIRVGALVLSRPLTPDDLIEY